DMEKWFDIIEMLQGFYEGNPIVKFDEAVQVLKNHQQDLEIIHNEELEDIAQRMKQILLQEEPSKDISQLPKLTDDLKNIIQEETDKQKQAVLVQSDKSMGQLKDLYEQYSQYEKITAYIQSRIDHATQLYEKIKNSERISSARINQQQLGELVDSTKSKARQMLKEIREETDTDRKSDVKGKRVEKI